MGSVKDKMIFYFTKIIYIRINMAYRINVLCTRNRSSMGWILNLVVADNYFCAMESTMIALIVALDAIFLK